MKASTQKPGVAYCPHTGEKVAMTLHVHADGDEEHIDKDTWRGTPMFHEDAHVRAEWTSREITEGGRADTRYKRVIVYVHEATTDEQLAAIREWADERDDVGP